MKNLDGSIRTRARSILSEFSAHTTKNSEFVVCHRHSAKTKKHSAKDLLSVTLSKQHTTSTVPTNVSLSSVFYRALGKYFARAETDVRRKKVTRRRGDGHDAFAECQLPDTQQTCILCRVPNSRHSANFSYFAVCQILGTRQSFLLC